MLNVGVLPSLVLKFKTSFLLKISRRSWRVKLRVKEAAGLFLVNVIIFRSEVLRADGDRIHDVIMSRGNVAKVDIIIHSYS